MEVTNPWEQRFKDLAKRYDDLATRTAVLDAVDRGDIPDALARLMSKGDRQRQALAILNRRVRTQRLQLRRLNELDRGLTAQEWEDTKKLYPTELEDSDQVTD